MYQIDKNAVYDVGVGGYAFQAEVKGIKSTYVIQLVDGYFQSLFRYADDRRFIIKNRRCTDLVQKDLKQTYEELFEEIEQHIIKEIWN